MTISFSTFTICSSLNFFNYMCAIFRYIYELDLRRFMLKEEVDLVFPLIDVAEMGQIDKKALTEWVVIKIPN